MKKINVTIIGVGSFTKALVEGVSFYTKNPEEKQHYIKKLELIVFSNPLSLSDLYFIFCI